MFGTTKTPVVTATLALVACGGGAPADVELRENDTEPSVFLTELEIRVEADELEAVRFEVRPRIDALAAPLSARYAIDALRVDDGVVSLPVFGLYSDHTNLVEVTLERTNGSTETLIAPIETGPYEDLDGPYDQIEVTLPAVDRRRPDFSYMLLENGTSQGPIVVDIDGYVRWVASDAVRRWPVTFDGNRFVVGEMDALSFIGLDGRTTRVPFSIDGVEGAVPHREIAFGPRGYLVSVDLVRNGELEFAPFLAEIDEDGAVLDTWDFSRILADHITAAGGDPSGLVRPNAEWFVLNSTVYSPADRSLIVSSRENFVMKIDYRSKAIRWIFGDETKHWFVNVPALRRLSIASDDPRPIGQHSLSLVAGDLMLFNNGEPSFRQPDGTPAGQRLPSSLAMIYEIDEDTMAAEATWTHDAGIFSALCSSIYRAGRHFLVTYSSVGTDPDPKRAIIRGIDEDGALLFEMVVPATPRSVCRPWSSEIIDLTDVRFDE